MKKAMLVILASSFLFSSFSHSAVILKLKGKKALIDLEGAEAEVEDKFDAINLYGKVLGILRIQKVKGGRAIGILLKGRMGLNWILEPSGSSETQQESSVTEEYISENASTTRSVTTNPYYNGIGFLGGPHFNLLRLSESKSISGWGGKISGFLDFFFTNYLAVRLDLGYQILIANGTSCGQGITNCHLRIHYPSLDLSLRWVLLQNKTLNLWIGGGGAMMWPIADKKYDLGLDEKSFKSFHGSLKLSYGTDIRLRQIYIPIQMEFAIVNPILVSLYSLKQGSKEFKPIYITLKAGVGFPF